MSPRIEYRVTARKTVGYQLWLYSLKFLNIIMIAAPFAACWFLFYDEVIRTPFFGRGHWVLIGLFTLLYFWLCKLYSGFKISINRMSEIVYSQSLSFFMADFFMYIVISLLSKKLVFVPPMLILLIVQFCMSLLWTCFAHRAYFKRIKPMRTIIIWDMRESLEKLINDYKLDRRFEVIGNYNISDCIENIGESLKDAEAVFLCGIHSRERNIIVKHCINAEIRAYMIPRVGDVLMSGAKSVHMLHLPIMTLERYNPSPEFIFFKRLMDIVLSAVALVVLSPLMITVALIIKKDGGTAFYKQKRLTKDRKEFYVLKFRSMRMDAEKDGVARLSSGENDDRITPVGKFIRKVRIDELPQLINILKGELSIVGPRPERPEIAAQYEKEMPEFSLRLQAKAGLTGLAQVYGKYNTTPYDKLLMDLQYIANPSLAQDLKIIFATVKILFQPESTEGIAEGQTTAMETEKKEKAEV